MNPARLATATAVALSVAGGLLAGTTSSASAAADCASPVHKRQFFANTTFSGSAKKTDCDTTIDENWGTGAPATGLPKDNFAVRWSVTRDFGSGGPFSFAAAAQDGIRVYLDGSRKVDLWKNVSTTAKKTVDVTVPKGRHTVRVDYVNWTGRANVKFTYTPRTSATVDKVAPLAPTGTAVSYDATAGRAKLSWSKNKELDLGSYRVYRRLKGTSFGGTPLKTTTSTSYTDTALPADGRTYYYEVRATDKAGNTSPGSADQGVTTADRTAPGQVTGVAVRGSTAGNVVTWTASSASDLDHYVVERTRNGEPLDPEYIAQATDYTDIGAEVGVPYTYRVGAVDTAGNVSPLTAVVTATRPAASAVAAPTALTGTPADASTGLTWTGADGATSYHVYRRTWLYGGWTLLGSTTTASYEDTTAPRRTSFYYVAAVDATGAESAPSAQLTVTRTTAATATGPAAPRLTLVSPGMPARSAIRVTAAPGAGDEERGLQGYSWEIGGACGSSGTKLSTTGDISWTPPYNGPCTVTVYSVDAYGRQGEQSSSLEFFVGR
ncbi:fibronectin type III domain-containing protein [Streptomyces sp. NPDC101175]|uniref:fibronectin type III domain-containing protein n=1 Tax=Streptomyces sp. NPDC101175 TaxID=3366123 RepID=UPI003833E736